MYNNNNNNNNNNGGNASYITATMISHMMSRSTPKDTITVQKVPRRQKSSRYYTCEKVELEKYPNFHGKHYYYYFRLDWIEFTSIN